MNKINIGLYLVLGIGFWLSMKFCSYVSLVIISWVIMTIFMTINFNPIYAIYLLLLCLLNDISRDITGSFTVYTIEVILLSVSLSWIFGMLLTKYNIYFYSSQKQNFIKGKYKFELPEYKILVISWIVFFGIILLSFIKSVNIPASIKQTLRYLEIFLIYLIAFNFINKDNYSHVLKLFLCLSSIISIIAIYQYFRFSNDYLAVKGTVFHHNTLASFLLYSIFITLSFLVITKHWRKIIFVIVIILNLFALKFSFSRGGWLSLILTGLILILMYKKKFVLGLISVTILTIFFISFIPDNSRYKLAKSEIINNIRRDLAKVSLNIIKNEPLLGFGVGNYFYKYKNYIKNISPSIEYIMEGGVINYYLHLTIETGVLGLISFLSIIFFHLKYLIKGINKITVYENKVILVGLTLSLISFLIHINFERILNIHFMGILFGLILGMSIKLVNEFNEQQEKAK